MQSRSIITALELIGLDDSTMPPGQVRKVLTFVEHCLADNDEVRTYGGRLSLTGHHAIQIAPIKPSGLLPFNAVLSMVHFQSELIQAGVPVRGAITIGDAATRGPVFFGQGIADAERLRDEVALVPRVIVHPRLLREVELNANLRAAQHTP
ncbi:MAG TPA: hypothetical protein VLS89_06330, partial [Candidatus Nanopelagicales bacterium]|nr:hypothetical protein [Candidatus Nanopelagicales bacterium]